MPYFRSHFLNTPHRAFLLLLLPAAVSISLCTPCMQAPTDGTPTAPGVWSQLASALDRREAGGSAEEEDDEDILIDKDEDDSALPSDAPEAEPDAGPVDGGAGEATGGGQAALDAGGGSQAAAQAAPADDGDDYVA